MRNFEKLTKRSSSRKDFAKDGRKMNKMNKVKRDRSHKRNWA